MRIQAPFMIERTKPNRKRHKGELVYRVVAMAGKVRDWRSLGLLFLGSWPEVDHQTYLSRTMGHDLNESRIRQ